jgi:quinol monooxygenase YgiN
MFVVAARYYTKEGKDNEVAEILKKMTPISRAEPGCALYVVNRSTEDPRKFLLYEQYRGKAGYEAHMATEAFKENILGKAVPLLESRERDFYETLD